jgi:D-alanyl-D-alanine dipeptidase
MKHVLISTLLLISVTAFSADLPSGFVYLSYVSPSIVQEIRYYTEHNFLGTKVDGYKSPKCILTTQAANALNNVQKDLEKKELSLKVYDCYRPQKAVNHFIRWAKDTTDTKTKAEFYPDEPKETLFKRGFIASRSGHSRGSTVDLTIIKAEAPEQEEYIAHLNLRRCDNPQQKRFGDNSINMGTGFDCFSDISATENKNISDEVRKNRQLLKSLMEKHGFYNYSKEWWHYTLKNEPHSKTFFDFEVK